MSSVTVLDRAATIERAAGSMGLQGADLSTDALIAQALRRTIFIAAPCSYRTARSLTVSALSPLFDDPDVLKTSVEDILNDLVAMGDIFEMQREATLGFETVLRPAPPAFVARDDATFVLLGVAGDEITPHLDYPVHYHASGLRMITAQGKEACREALLGIGLIDLPKRTWMHAPTIVSAREHVDFWKAQLPGATHPEKIEGLQFLDGQSSSSFYKARWKPLSNQQCGIFVARRPQRYGAELWCLADVKDGFVHRFIDIHPRDRRFRACDEAWRLQAAMDNLAGSPQRVLVKRHDGRAVLCFTAPLPLWATRRLSLIGEQIMQKGALLAFELYQNNLEEELRWLEDILWLAREEGGTP